jgi:hypothetical protein
MLALVLVMTVLTAGGHETGPTAAGHESLGTDTALVPVGQSFTVLGKGVDSCAAPDTTTMKNFWTATPYYYWPIYIGGSQRGCAQPNLTSSWIKTVTSGPNTAWNLLPIWVGPQDPCQPGYGDYISLDTATAYQQGKNNASSAVITWANLGQNTDTPIVYDLEAGPNADSSACKAAVNNFVNGWVYQLRVQPAQKAGLYTSVCGGQLSSFAYIPNVPDFVWGADYTGDPSTGNLDCVPSGYWVNQQRHKQYWGGHNETWNGSTVNVDNDCANSWTYGTQSYSVSQGC